MLGQFIAQKASGRCWIGLTDDAGADRNSFRSRCQYLVDGIGIDMSDRISRQFADFASLLDVFDSDCLTMPLGGSFVDGTDSDVVSSTGGGYGSLIGSVGR